MATGTLKMWNADRGYGFIGNDAGCPCRKPYEVGHSTAPPALLTSEERDRLEAVL